MTHGVSGFGTADARNGAGWAVTALILCALSAPCPARAAAYDVGYVRMAEILGAVHHLRSICTPNEGAMWRNKMIDMLGYLPDQKAQRDVMISHFNSYYHHYERRYRSCSPQAVEEANQLFDEAQILARRLASQNLAP